MFSWITGSRMTNAIEDLQADTGYETTFVEGPETPAHQFAVKAFKHAIFGTPAPEETNNAGKKLQKKPSPDAANEKPPELPPPKANGPPVSPSKQPGGILMTPGTSNKGRKSVSFGAQVVDNEGKRGNASKSGIPSDFPGKFPSPWTPGTELKADAGSEQKPRTKLTAALLDARTTTIAKSGQKPKAKDDSDITIDLNAPRSESGRYWKEQYESYAERSEKEMKKLVAKQQLAKNYAKMKDGEMTEIATRLEQERKRFRQRERGLEQQNKDYQERLRQAMAEKTAASVEITALRNRIATLEKSIIMPSSEVHESESKPSFQIYEDSSKAAVKSQSEQDKGAEASCTPPIGKENSPPKPRHVRHQTLPDASSHRLPSLGATARIGAEANQVSIILAKSPRVAAGTSETITKPNLAPPSLETTSKSPLSVRRHDLIKENLLPKSPALVLPSSPLPQPSPDPWMNVNDSPLPQMDKMALPMSTAPSYSRPVRPAGSAQPRLHRTSNTMSHATATTARQVEKSVAPDNKPTASKVTTEGTEKSISHDGGARTMKTATSVIKDSASEELRLDAPRLPKQDPKFDVAKMTGHHAEGSSQVKRDRVEMLPVDRKAEAKRRLQEKKQRKMLAQ